MRFLRNISFTFAECSLNKTEFHKNLTVQEVQSTCRFHRYPILNVFPATEYLNNGKTVKEAPRPFDLSHYHDKSFGAVYLSCDGIDDVWLREAHRVARRVLLYLPKETAGSGDLITLMVKGARILYEHRRNDSVIQTGEIHVSAGF